MAGSWFYRLAIALLQLANVCGQLGMATSMRAPAAAAAARDSVRQQPEWHRRRAQAPRRPVVVNRAADAWAEYAAEVRARAPHGLQAGCQPQRYAASAAVPYRGTSVLCDAGNDVATPAGRRVLASRFQTKYDCSNKIRPSSDKQDTPVSATIMPRSTAYFDFSRT